MKIRRYDVSLVDIARNAPYIMVPLLDKSF